MKFNFSRNSVAALTLSLAVVPAAGYIVRSANQQTQISSAPQSGESSRAPAIARQLDSLLAESGVRTVAGFQPSEFPNFRQITMHWEAAKAPASPAQAGSATLTVTKSTVGQGALPRRRSVELADTEVLIVAVDRESNLRWWYVMTDPRLLRTPTANPAGEISCEVIYLPRADFSFAYPDDPQISELRIYHPEWNGESFRLTTIGIVTVQ